MEIYEEKEKFGGGQTLPWTLAWDSNYKITYKFIIITTNNPSFSNISSRPMRFIPR